MKRLMRLSLFAGIVLASIWTTNTARAQDPAATKRDKAVIDSVTIRDVEKAADQLALAVQAAVRKATEDPALKAAALKVAKNAVVAAQVVITQQAETLQAVLDSLAREIAIATDKQQAKAKAKAH